MDCQENFDALRRHYSGEGNASRRVATSDPLRETLHCKSKCEFPFNMFLDSIHKTFNIFRDEWGPMANSTQVCELFRRVQNPQLQDTVKALEFILTLTELHIQRQLTTSQLCLQDARIPIFPKFFRHSGQWRQHWGQQWLRRPA